MQADLIGPINPAQTTKEWRHAALESCGGTYSSSSLSSLLLSSSLSSLLSSASSLPLSPSSSSSHSSTSSSEVCSFSEHQKPYCRARTEGRVVLLVSALPLAVHG